VNQSLCPRRGTLSYDKLLNCIYDLQVIDCEDPHWSHPETVDNFSIEKAYHAILEIEDRYFLADAAKSATTLGIIVSHPAINKIQA